MTTTDERLNRISTQRHLHAMVACDNLHAVAERIERLLSHGRRVSIAHRFATWTGQPPELHVGLTAKPPKQWFKDDDCGWHVALDGGRSILGFGFGITAYRSENATEADAWKRYHAGKAESEDYFERRRDMTEVEIIGGLANDGPARDDMIAIRRWNRDGVCDEKVICFDHDLWRSENLGGDDGRA